MKKITKNIKENYQYYVFFFFFFILNLAYFKKMYVDLNHNNTFFIISIIVCIIEISLFILYNFMRKKDIPIEKIYLCFSIIIGIFYLVALPIGSAPDEYTHFKREYEISMGHMTSAKNSKGIGGRKLPISIKNVFKLDVNTSKYNELFNLFSLKDNKNKEFQPFAGASLYSPVCYIPQVIGILIGRMFQLPMIFIAYLSRLFNLICFSIIIYFNIKYTPINKKLLILFSFLPSTMQAAISCQPDALTIAIAFSLVSFTLYKINNKQLMTKKEKIIMCLLAIIMSLCKIVYVPICLILYLIPDSCFNSKKDKYLKITLLGFCVVIINLIWLAISSSYLIEFRPGVNSVEQLKFILLNPIDYCYILFNTYNELGMFYLFTSMGSSLGFLNIGVSQSYLLIYLLFIFYIIIHESSQKKFIDTKAKFLLLFIIIVCILLIFTSLYLQWNEVKNSLVLGVQGRYFIPLFMIISLVIQHNTLALKQQKIDKYCFVIIIMVSFYAIMSVVKYYI